MTLILTLAISYVDGCKNKELAVCDEPDEDGYYDQNDLIFDEDEDEEEYYYYYYYHPEDDDAEDF